MNSVRLLFRINRKMVNTIWFWFDLIRFRKDFPVCLHTMRHFCSLSDWKRWDHVANFSFWLWAKWNSTSFKIKWEIRIYSFQFEKKQKSIFFAEICQTGKNMHPLSERIASLRIMMDQWSIRIKPFHSTLRKKRWRQSASLIRISVSVICFEVIFSSKRISDHFIRIYDPTKSISIKSRSPKVISDSLFVYLYCDGSKGFRGVFNWHTWLPRDTNLSYSYTQSNI